MINIGILFKAIKHPLARLHPPTDDQAKLKRWISRRGKKFMQLPLLPSKKNPAVKRHQQTNKKARTLPGADRNSRFPARVKNLFKQYQDKIEKWAAISVAHQLGKGVHFQSSDDAAAAGIYEGLQALRRYDPRSGPAENFLRPSIKFGIMKHLAWERGHGMTGNRTLYDLIHRAVGDDETRQKIAESFPEISEINETLPTGTIEDVMEQARTLLLRDNMLDAIEKEFKINLRQARRKLEQKERSRETWKTISLAKRKLDIFRMKSFENMSFREIATKLDIGVARVYEDFQSAMEMVKKIRAKMLAAQAKKDTKKALSSGRSNEERFLMNLARLEGAIENEFPEEFIDFLLDRLAVLYCQLEDTATQQ